MWKRYNYCSHGMSARTIYLVFAAAATTVVAIVRAAEQPDVVGPPVVYKDAVSAVMAMDPELTNDVAEMLVAAEILQAMANNGGSSDRESSDKLTRALDAMDDLQREAADLFDQSYDDFLDLYPLWRKYVQCDDPLEREVLFNKYLDLLQRYEQNRQELAESFGILMSLEQALLPSNAFVDPTGRIPASANTPEVLRNFQPDDKTDEDEGS